MTQEIELVESIDKISGLIEKLKSEILTGDLKEYTLRQLYYIELINKYENISISEISRMLEVKKSTVSIAINHLIEQGIVIKVQSTTDKRFYFLKLTPKGKNIIKIHMQVHKNAIKRILEILNKEEVDNFIKIVNKLTTSGL
ncbi:MAG: winged helix DNA-binding protein [Methanobacteriaceae archaeon]|jgi:DNA-binding MarR family transcriptional regulator|nr:winged helix DNA-binding protein [Methanobacteriaceae archaeon]